MQIHALDGTVLEISPEEAHRIYDEISRQRAAHATPVTVRSPEHHGDSHHFHIGGRQVAVTKDEMREIADAWWEKHGRRSMEHYFTDMKAKAAEHIEEAVGGTHELKDEPAIKRALAHALAEGDADLVAEVIHEVVEWVNADSGLRSIARG